MPPLKLLLFPQIIKRLLIAIQIPRSQKRLKRERLSKYWVEEKWTLMEAISLLASIDALIDLVRRASLATDMPKVMLAKILIENGFRNTNPVLLTLVAAGYEALDTVLGARICTLETKDQSVASESNSRLFDSLAHQQTLLGHDTLSPLESFCFEVATIDETWCRSTEIGSSKGK